MSLGQTSEVPAVRPLNSPPMQWPSRRLSSFCFESRPGAAPARPLIGIPLSGSVLMQRRRLLLLLGPIVLVSVCLFPQSESTFEFDAANLRLRECSRSRSWMLGFAFSERCSPTSDHPTAARLRELGVIPAVIEADARWVLIKGFKPGVRGWKGAGSEYLRALGPTSFGTPVALPASEDVSSNVWIRWAAKDSAAASQFWGDVRKHVLGGRDGSWEAARSLMVVGRLLEERDCQVSAGEVSELFTQAVAR